MLNGYGKCLETVANTTKTVSNVKLKNEYT